MQNLRYSLFMVMIFWLSESFGQLLIPKFEVPQKIQSISSDAEELAPIPYRSGDVLYFVRSYEKGKAKERKKAQEIWQVERKNGVWGEPLNIFEEANDLGNNAVIGSSKRGDTIYIFNSIQSRRKLARGIAYTYKKEKGWADLKKIEVEGFEIGDGLYSFYISETEDVLLISMAPNDTTRNEDLFVSTKTNGVWSKVESLGSTINTKGFEISPFISKDKKALYFSSNGHGGEGDADVFVSYRLGKGWNEWTKPLNLGPEINSPSFDAYFVIGNNREVYFSSNRDSENTEIYTTKLLVGKSVVLAGRTTLGQFYHKGEAQEGVKLEIYDKNGNFSETVKTDQEGKFNYKKLQTDEIGMIQIAEEDQSDFPNGIIYLLDNKENKSRRILSNPDGTYTIGGKRFVAGEIQGVFNYKSLPLQNEAVLVYNENGDVVDTVYTDEFGRFNYRKLQIDENYSFKPMNVEESDDLNLTINFDSRIDDLMSGSFTYKKLPFSGQQVLIYNSAGEIVDTLITDENGRFTYRKLASDESYSFRPLNLPEEELEDFDISVDYDSRLEKEMQGSFTYKKLPFGGQKVLVYNEAGEIVDTLITDENGRFNYRKLNADENYTFKPANLTDEELADFSMGLDQQLVATKGSFSYKKLPFSNQKIIVYNEEGEAIDTLITDENGAFIYRKLSADENYTFKPANWSDEELVDFDIEVIESDNQIREFVRGTILVNGKPYPNKAFVLMDENGFPLDTIYTGEKGRFEYFKLKGDYNYQVRALDTEDADLVNVQIYYDTDKKIETEALSTAEKEKDNLLKKADRKSIDNTLYFEFNQYTLTKEHKSALDNLTKNVNTAVVVIGYTDNIGSNSNNLKVARWRAEAVKEYLIMKSVKPSLISTEARGQASPISDNSTAKGRAKNRRVEIH